MSKGVFGLDYKVFNFVKEKKNTILKKIGVFPK